MRSFPLPFLLPLLALACQHSGSDSAGLAPATTNVGGTLGGVFGAGPLVVLTESEFDQQRDLNRDGDRGDLVFSILDLDTGRRVTTGLVMAMGIPRTDIVPQPLLRTDPTPTMLVDELASGEQDLDGDGNAFGWVLFRYDRERGELENLGLAAASVHANDEFLAFDASGEHPRDLDGDGSFDLVPGVPSVRELASGVTYSTGLVGARILALADESLALVFDERVSGDQNGDLDEADSVLALYDVRRRLYQPVGLALPSFFGLVPRPFGGEGVWLSEVFEAAQGGQDLNGDGDGDDRVLLVLDMRDGAVLRLLDGLTPIDRETDGGLVALQEPSLGGSSGRIWLYDIARDQLEDTGFAGNYVVRRAHDVALFVDEESQGEDLDANGVLASGVTVLYERGSGRVHVLGVEGPPIAREGGLLLLSFEGFAARDWNGDGDQDDLVPFVWDEGDERPRSTGLAVANAQPLDARRALVLLDEETQDRNGDGDRLDVVAAVLELDSGHQTNLGLATLATFPLAGPPRILAVSESGQGADLNGDGDALDVVPYWIELE